MKKPVMSSLYNKYDYTYYCYLLQNGGAVVVTVDQKCGYLQDNKSHLPLYLLTREVNHISICWIVEQLI